MPSVVGGIDPGDPCRMECGHLVGQNRASAAPEHLDAGPAFLEEPHQVAEVLHVPTLVARDRDPLDILLDGAVHDLGHRAVVAEVDHLRPGGLEDASHHVDGRVVTVEEGRGCHQSDGIGGLIDGGGFHGRNIVPARPAGDRSSPWNP